MRPVSLLAPPPSLAAHDVTVAVGGRIVVANWHWSAHGGQWWVLLGPNGVGKSTLLATLAGLRSPTTGMVTLADRPLAAWPLRQLARQRGFLPQQPLFPDSATVWEAVLIGRHPHLGRWKWAGAQDEAIAHAALATMDLAGLIDRPVATLSGGERQRLALAAILTQQPAVFFLDEPINHLDLRHQVALLDALEARREAGALVITALHDLHWAARYATGVLLLSGNGAVVAGPAAEWLAPEPLSALYGVPLVAHGHGKHRYFVPAVSNAAG